MTLQALTYFVAVAEQKNFTKAAHQCFVTQPALSRAISDLEKEMGRPLLHRSSKGIELTPAGQVCYEEARSILRQCSMLVDRVKNNTDATRGVITLGYLFNNSLNMLADKIRQFSRLYPNVELRTTYEDFLDAKQMLHSGELDLVLLAEPSALALGDSNTVETVTVIQGGLHAVVHASHPLFSKDVLTFEDIKSERFIMWDPVELPGLYRATMDAFYRVGIEPQVAAYAKKLGDAIAFATFSGGLGLTTCVATKSGGEEVRIPPVIDCPAGFGISLSRLKSGTNPFAESFFSHIQLSASH